MVIYESTGSSRSNLRVVPIFSMRFIAQTKLSKLDLVRYYLSVVPDALAGIRDRPLVLKRFVDKLDGEVLSLLMSTVKDRFDGTRKWR